MAQHRYFLKHDDRIPAKWASVLERGAIVNGAQTVASGSTVTVHAEHEFASGDKALYALERDNISQVVVFSISGTTSTTLTISPAITVPDKAILINLGADTGGVIQTDGSYSKPNWDAAAVTIYKDPNGDEAHSNSRVDVDPGGELGYWGAGTAQWIVLRQSGGDPIRAYMDIEVGGTTSASGAALPAFGSKGQTYLLEGPPDILYAWMANSAGVEDWEEIAGAS